MSRHQGDIIEQQALDYLLEHKLKLLERNYAGRQGEIDLIMLDGKTLTFVEVRYRRSRQHGSSAESVDWRKQQKLISTAQLFLQTHKKLQNHVCRFDVIACSPEQHGTKIEWIKDAFQP